MSKSNKKQTDLVIRKQSIQQQFNELDFQDPASWDIFPKLLACLVIIAVIIAAAWFAFLSAFQVELEEAKSKEEESKNVFIEKFKKASNLEALKKQREQIEQYVGQLEKQLPGKSEMSALLSDINQAGLGRSLQFELFRPGQQTVKNYYAELPVAIKVTGKYHDIGMFASDISHLSRIVTLGNVTILPIKDNLKDNALKDASLVMEGTIRTFRYLDSEEISSQKKPK